VLIALTTRHHGATVVTANRADFDLLAPPPSRSGSICLKPVDAAPQP
jgi:hypothetical protein